MKLEMPEATRAYLLSWIKSLTLADHARDMWNDVGDLLKAMDEDFEWSELDELKAGLEARGVKYLHELEGP